MQAGLPCHLPTATADWAAISLRQLLLLPLRPLYPPSTLNNSPCLDSRDEFLRGQTQEQGAKQGRHGDCLVKYPRYTRSLVWDPNPNPEVPILFFLSFEIVLFSRSEALCGMVAYAGDCLVLFCSARLVARTRPHLVFRFYFGCFLL
jgi:hypothetical protein